MTPWMKQAAIFYVLACAVSWGLLAAFLGSGGQFGTPASMVLLIAYMWGPALAAMGYAQFGLREHVPASVGLRPRFNMWLLWSWLLPVALLAGTLLVTVLWPGMSLSFDMEAHLQRFASQLTPEQFEEARQKLADVNPALFVAAALAQALFAGTTVNAIAAAGEEIGWRGLLQRLLAPMGFWRSSVVIGVLWGLWHAPIVLLGHNYPEHPQLGVLMMVVFCVLVSPLASWLRLRAGTTFSAAIFHGTINALGGFAVLFVVGGSDLTRGMTGAVGFVALAAANVVLAVKGVGRAEEALRELAAEKIPPPA